LQISRQLKAEYLPPRLKDAEIHKELKKRLEAEK